MGFTAWPLWEMSALGPFQNSAEEPQLDFSKVKGGTQSGGAWEYLETRSSFWVSRVSPPNRMCLQRGWTRIYGCDRRSWYDQVGACLAPC